LLLFADKKALAERAAAARAYDCWCLRLEGRTSDYLCLDQPYLNAEDAPTCPSFPQEVKQKIVELQEEAKTRMPVPVILKPALPPQTEEERLKDREEYRATRRANNTTNMDADLF